MKKISKFRAWLIRKLGGVTPLDKPIIIERNKVNTLTFESKEIFTQEEFGYMCKNFPRYTDREIKQDLWQKLGEQAIPLVRFDRYNNLETGEVTFRARLTVVEE